MSKAFLFFLYTRHHNNILIHFLHSADFRPSRRSVFIFGQFFSRQITCNSILPIVNKITYLYQYIIRRKEKQTTFTINNPNNTTYFEKVLVLLFILMLSSCAPSNEGKAAFLIKETLKGYLYHPDSYEPISLRIDSMFIDATTIKPIVETTNEIKRLLPK